jgi:hypothetical protein
MSTQNKRDEAFDRKIGTEKWRRTGFDLDQRLLMKRQVMNRNGFLSPALSSKEEREELQRCSLAWCRSLAEI